MGPGWGGWLEGGLSRAELLRWLLRRPKFPCPPTTITSFSPQLTLLLRTPLHPPPAPADILVDTPGRLIAHLEGTPGFTLAHLRFLVVDETDRLLRQAYQDWLPKVMAALQQPWAAAAAGGGPAAPAVGGGWGARDAAGLAAPEQQQEQQQQQASGRQPARRVVKFVVSATLTRDPSKIDRLGLHCPRYIAMSAGAWWGRLRAWLQQGQFGK